MKCQCPAESFGNSPESMYSPEELKARIHEAGKCPGDYDLAYYYRAGKEIVLCSACCVYGDRRLDKKVPITWDDLSEDEKERRLDEAEFGLS